jgi:hypothetical protein
MTSARFTLMKVSSLGNSRDSRKNILTGAELHERSHENDAALFINSGVASFLAFAPASVLTQARFSPTVAHRES